MSGDPALGEYIPSPGTEPSKLVGMGGVYNTINLHAYHYGGNNPIKYVDPDGSDIISFIKGWLEHRQNHSTNNAIDRYNYETGANIPHKIIPSNLLYNALDRIAASRFDVQIL